MADPNVKRGPAPPQTSLEDARAKMGTGATGAADFAKGSKAFSRQPKREPVAGRRAPPRLRRTSPLTGHTIECACAMCQATGKAGDKTYTPKATELAHPQEHGAKDSDDKLPKPEKKPKK